MTLFLPRFAKYEDFTEHIVDDNHDHIGKELHHLIIDVKPANTYPHTDKIQHKGSSPTAEEPNHLPENSGESFCLALKNPDSVGHIGEQDRQNLSDGSSPQVRYPKHICQNPITAPVHQGGKSAEKHVEDQFLVFKIERLDLFHTRTFLMIWPSKTNLFL